MKEHSASVQLRTKRAVMRCLASVGISETLARRRHQRIRKLRFAAEASGDDRMSRPALHGMDVKLDAIIGRRGGFFVEAGANDGFVQSNTYWLERFRGWRGLLIEPVPHLAAEARLSRPGSAVVQCALVSFDADGCQLKLRYGDLMTSVAGAKDAEWARLGTETGWRQPYEFEVEGRTLSSLLDEIRAPEVGLLSLDVEGFEVEALRGLDLDRHAPRFVLVEIHDRDRDQPPIDELLLPRYAHHGWLSPLDLLYVRRDVAGQG